jgi:hypothetical protein
MTNPAASVDAFILRWQGREGGQERANYALFLSELCDVLGVSRPDPASASTEENDYVFERLVRRFDGDQASGFGRIDLYRRGCFVLEAKQSRQKGGKKEIPNPSLPGLEPPKRGVADAASRSWDVLMLNARRQAASYARALPVEHGWPPFILVCDVGHVIETYADFSGQGKNYAQFPDRQSFRIYLEDLRRPEVRERLAHIWNDPLHLDPARHAARVTRDIAARLAAVSKALEQGHDAEQVAMFLMRCLFTMFACSPGIQLLPEASFHGLLQRCESDPKRFTRMVGQLWEAMDTGDFAYALEAKVRQFNGEFFKDRTVLPLGREEIGELRSAAAADWRDVDPSIFGTLLEQALSDTERRRLGAHYTPRAYVERLVVATVIEPLRADWGEVLSAVERQKTAGRAVQAVQTVRDFHDKLCRTRVLDPACGSGNFLYVSLELMKRLEGEVLETLVSLGGQEALTGLPGHTVDPHQFLGLEINPRASAIAELVLWIGYLQWHLKVRGGIPEDPILRAFHNIQRGFNAVLKVDADDSDDKGAKRRVRGAGGAKASASGYKNPRQPSWPPSEFIVGNPPFIGGKDIRARLGDQQAEALWAAHPAMNESADFVMYWWDHAASLLTCKDTALRRFGFVSTNSITQMFQRRVVERHMAAKLPVSIVMAIPDHPWTKATRDAAAVRIAMTVAEAGLHEGVVRETVREAGLDSDTPIIEFRETSGIVNPDLTVGVDLSRCTPLVAHIGLSSRGMSLHGSGFIVTPLQAEHLGLGRRRGLEEHIREYRNGRDLTGRTRGVMVIDLFGLSVDQVRGRYPEVYQHLSGTVKRQRDTQLAKSSTKDAEAYARDWWLFGKPRQELRPALERLSRYIATVETMKHRIFVFLDGEVVPDNKLIVVGSDDAFLLGVLSSRIHTCWALRAGGWLGVGNDPVYVKSRCFEPFPFPDASDLQKQRIRAIAEELDTHRKRVLAENTQLTLTGLYNVLELLRVGTMPEDLEATDLRIFDAGLVLIMKEIHDSLDAAVSDAYGWPAKLVDNEILARLVALNQERVREEANGQIRWLRSDYQVPRFGTDKDKLALTGGAIHDTQEAGPVGPKPSFPTSELEQAAAVVAMLNAATEPLSGTALALRFRQGRRVLPQIDAVLHAMLRVGGLIYSTDGGQSFATRRAA